MGGVDEYPDGKEQGAEGQQLGRDGPATWPGCQELGYKGEVDSTTWGLAMSVRVAIA